MQYFNPTTKAIEEDAALLASLGLVSVTDLNSHGWYMLFVESPLSATLVPKWFQTLQLGEPSKIPNDNAYVQKFELVPVDKPAAELKAELLEAINNKRKAAESGGFVTLDGHKIHSDQKTQQTVAEAARKIEEGVIQEPINWLSTDSFMSLTLLQLKQIGAGIAMHVQYCFNRQKQLWDEVQAIDLTSATAKEQLFAVAVDSGWPTPAE